VHRHLARSPFVESFREAPAERGGWGATLVWLRNRGALKEELCFGR